MQPSSKCALSKACCWSWGGPKEGLVPLSCRRRPPSRPPTSASRSLARQRTWASTHTPGQPAGPADTRRRQPSPLCGRSCQGPREPPGARITGRQGDEAERSEDPVRLKSLAGSFVASRHQTRPDQRSAVRIRKCAGPSFEFWIDSQPISRISHPAPDHNLFPSSNVQFTIWNTFVYQPRGADRHLHLYMFHMSSSSLYLVLQHPQSNPGEGSQTTQSISSVSQPAFLQTRSESKAPLL